MNRRILLVLILIAFPFGLIGAVMAYLSAYSGWSHFPGITREKRIAFALEMAGLALFMVISCFIVVLYIFRE